MNRDHTKIATNIRNYTNLSKGLTTDVLADWITPTVDAYGLPSLNLTRLPTTNSISKKRPSKAKRVVLTSFAKLKRNDSNFLLGTAITTLLFIFSIIGYHNLIVLPQTSIALESSSTDLNKSSKAKRLNLSPASLLVGEPMIPELIPGIVKEEEIASCALIVGSFSRKSNAIEMQQKVLAAGYNLHTEEFQDFYRVGILIDCSDIKRASFSEIESSIGVDPWLRISF